MGGGAAGVPKLIGGQLIKRVQPRSEVVGVARRGEQSRESRHSEVGCAHVDVRTEEQTIRHRFRGTDQIGGGSVHAKVHLRVRGNPVRKRSRKGEGRGKWEVWVVAEVNVDQG